MPRYLRRSLIAIACGLSGLAACTYNEQLGRNQLLIGNSSSLASAAAQSWEELKQKQPVSRDSRYTARLNRVAPKVLRAAGEDPSQWEWLVFEDDSLNAFALPGGRFGVFTGIMDIMENDAQLATVVGHEIAHVKFNHAQERSSQGTFAQLGLGLGAVLAGAGCDGSAAERRACEQRSGALVQALGMGAIYGVILPYSRKHESESDVFGIRYMARAGYDVCESIDFWQNMAQASAGQQRPPEFASTHPSGETRISLLRAEAQQLGRNCG
jgi:predicted Zn-dependent protease